MIFEPETWVLVALNGLWFVGLLVALVSYLALGVIWIHGGIRGLWILTRREIPRRTRLEKAFMSTSGGLGQGLIVYLLGVVIVASIMVLIGLIAIVGQHEPAGILSVTLGLVEYVDPRRLITLPQQELKYWIWWGTIFVGLLGHGLHWYGDKHGFSRPEQSSIERIVHRIPGLELREV